MPLLCAVILLSPPASSSAAEAKAIFAQSEAKLKAAKTLEGEKVSTPEPRTERFLLAKPRSFRVESPDGNIICDGHTQWNTVVRTKEYFTRNVHQTGGSGWPISLDGFYGQPTGGFAPFSVISTTFEMRKSGGKRIAAKTMVFAVPNRKVSLMFLVDSATKLPVGWDEVVEGQRKSFRLKRLVLGAKVPAGAFAWKPPAGYKEKILAQ